MMMTSQFNDEIAVSHQSTPSGGTRALTIELKSDIELIRTPEWSQQVRLRPLFCNR